MRRRVTAIVQAAESGMCVLDFVVKRYPFKDEAQWQAALSDKQVLLNRTPASASATLKTNDAILYHAPEAPEPKVDRNIAVLYEDEHLIAVNKTGNLPCHPSGCYLENTLLTILKKNTGVQELRLINRLDRETSGVVLAAKNAAAAKHLLRQFLLRKVEKLYSVIVEGEFPEHIIARGWLSRDTDSVLRKKRAFVAGTRDAQPVAGAEWAETRFERVKSNHELSLVRVVLITGRLHQIRATLFSLGFPVVGDKIYGVDENLFLKFISDQLTESDWKKLRLPRQALHALELGITHPVTAAPMLFKAPLPLEMRELLNNRPESKERAEA
ncbi:MAG: RluA family pseudouridine synthase [Kiritimatiellae bacterium]|nr:RluA family pseudouridine synthase [Kiritimatiellia bacterium]